MVQRAKCFGTLRKEVELLHSVSCIADVISSIDKSMLSKCMFKEAKLRLILLYVVGKKFAILLYINFSKIFNITGKKKIGL